MSARDRRTVQSSIPSNNTYDPPDMTDQIPLEDFLGGESQDDILEEGPYTLGNVQDAVSAIVDSSYGPYVETAGNQYVQLPIYFSI
jgi:hypothetical protein